MPDDQPVTLVGIVGDSRDALEVHRSLDGGVALHDTVTGHGVDLTIPEARTLLALLMVAIGDPAQPEDLRNPSYVDLDVFQAEVEEWAFRNFGAPEEQKPAAYERLLDFIKDMEGRPITPTLYTELRDMVAAVELAPPGAHGLGSVMGVAEEAGELAEAVSAMSAVVNLTAAIGRLNHATLKGQQGIRYSPEQIDDMVLDAAGDVMVYLADAIARRKLKLSWAVEVAWGKVKQRDWKANPMNAAQVAEEQAAPEEPGSTDVHTEAAIGRSRREMPPPPEPLSEEEFQALVAKREGVQPEIQPLPDMADVPEEDKDLLFNDIAQIVAWPSSATPRVDAQTLTERAQEILEANPAVQAAAMELDDTITVGEPQRDLSEFGDIPEGLRGDLGAEDRSALGAAVERIVVTPTEVETEPVYNEED